MDLLESLNVGELPEQQTRTSRLLETHPDFDLKLGFDSCCYCGKEDPKIECENCRRVKYCSDQCRRKDCVPTTDDEDENDDVEEEALGHTSVICALLGLCNDDEAIETKHTAEMSTLDIERQTAATDRLVSEFESYPATLANVIMEGPCYQKTLEKCSGGDLTIHVVGASEDSELWNGHPDPSKERNVFEGYADALAEIAEVHKIQSIHLHFFGPECPRKNIDKTISIPPVQAKKSSTKLLVRSFNTDYKVVEGTNSTFSPDVVVFFNPGFTCPDYDWKSSISFLKTDQIPFLVTTNTEMEAMADLQYLHDRRIFLDIPVGLKGMLQNGKDDGDDVDDHAATADESQFFFGVNPYAGLRVRQSGTMGNDLYVKSRWILGGISSVRSGKTNRSETGKSSAAKKRRTEGSGNSKKSNPALI